MNDPGEFIGRVDEVTSTTIKGWAADKRDPSIRLDVEIEVGGICIGRSVCNLYRGDLVHAGIGDGTYGFEFPVPSALPRNAAVVVKVVGTGYIIRQNTKSATDDAPATQPLHTEGNDLATAETGILHPAQREEALLTLMLHAERVALSLNILPIDALINCSDDKLIKLFLMHVAVCND